VFQEGIGFSIENIEYAIFVACGQATTGV